MNASHDRAEPEAQPETAARGGWHRRFSGSSPRTRSVLLATGLLVVGLSPFAVARTGDALREGVRNGTAKKETQIIGSIKRSSKATGGYTTRQSNLSKSGGGAIYGCRASSSSKSETCVRANNLSNGRAFEFNAEDGLIAGVITAGKGGDSKKPLTTNATGVATGLNADEVDGLDGAQLRTRWFLVNAAGVIEAQSGGFTITACYPAAPAAANGNCYVNTGEDLTNNGVSATIALQNTTDQNGDTITNGRAPGDNANPEFSGEITASRCFTPGAGAIVNCAPTGTNNPNHVVVSPRNSDGSFTTDGTRKRFYVTITE